VITYTYTATYSGSNFSWTQSPSLKNITYKKQVWVYNGVSDSQIIVKVNPFGMTRTSMLMVSGYGTHENHVVNSFMHVHDNRTDTSEQATPSCLNPLCSMSSVSYILPPLFRHLSFGHIAVYILTRTMRYDDCFVLQPSPTACLQLQGRTKNNDRFRLLATVSSHNGQLHYIETGGYNMVTDTPSQDALVDAVMSPSQGLKPSFYKDDASSSSLFRSLV
jgi:hypothetical protein